MFSERGMKPVLHFHFPTDVLCPDGLPVVVYLFSFLVDTYRNDVHVFAVDVFLGPANVTVGSGLRLAATDPALLWTPRRPLWAVSVGGAVLTVSVDRG